MKKKNTILVYFTKYLTRFAILFPCPKTSSKGKSMALLEWVASFSFSVLLLCDARRQYM